jgi:hypothetical protein
MMMNNIVMLVVDLTMALYFTHVFRVVSNSTSNVLIRLPINPNDCQQHEFSLIRKPMQYNCEVCGEELIANRPYKECNICKLLVHIRCAEIPRTFKIKLHNHFLNLIYSPHEINKHDDIFCRICAGKVNKEYAAYNCQKCSYNVHTECLRRFRSWYGESSATSESVPNESVGRVTHLIKALDQAEDEGPHLGEIQHFSHLQHKLILCDGEIKDDKLCQGCMELIISVPTLQLCTMQLLSSHSMY